MATDIRLHEKAKQDFLHLFPEGFADPSYLKRERNYKVAAHYAWNRELNEGEYTRLLRSEQFDEIAKRLLNAHRRLNLLSQFEQMALRDALKVDAGARILGRGLFDFLYGTATEQVRFMDFCNVLGSAPQEGVKLAKWPLQTIFLFIADPTRNLFLKPRSTQKAAQRFNFELNYRPGPNWLTYSRLLEFGRKLKVDLADWKPRDMIDIQGFIWVTTSAGYASELIP